MNKPMIAIVMGSDSDLSVMQDAASLLDSFAISYEMRVLSAHRTPNETSRFAKDIHKNDIKVVIAAAGKAAHLAGVIAAHTTVPVIGVPIKTSMMGGLDSLLSMVQMPTGVPVATVAINGATNAALLAVAIVASHNAEIAQKLNTYRTQMKKNVQQRDSDLQQKIDGDQQIQKAVSQALKTVTVSGFGKKIQGKVRDIYVHGNKRFLITTDRLSAFDVILGTIPYKGAVLTQLSKFWFDYTESIVPNHMISVPDPNVLVARECTPIPVEMIVRGYISGVTKTSIWYSYEKGERTIYGLPFPDGLRKNQELPEPVITPTTHPLPGSGLHDERLTREEIIEREIVSEKLYRQMEKSAIALFKKGSKRCKKQGLILVDTKYEFGLYKGKLMLMDEIHTPDSSRFWIAKTYQERFEKGLEPENFDKEFLRIYYAKKLNYRGDGTAPKIPDDLAIAVAKRYIKVYETITGKKFDLFSYPIESRIQKALENYQ